MNTQALLNRITIKLVSEIERGDVGLIDNSLGGLWITNQFMKDSVWIMREDISASLANNGRKQCYPVLTGVAFGNPVALYLRGSKLTQQAVQKWHDQAGHIFAPIRQFEAETGLKGFKFLVGFMSLDGVFDESPEAVGKTPRDRESFAFGFILRCWAIEHDYLIH